ncbi:hypothetical protein [Enterococcus sp. GC40]|uniref:hypothetical protein n=1 Tax=Enterococcus sp. GC40 TaxID=3231359 RepID=UPI00349FE184
MIEWYIAYGMFGDYLGVFSDYDRAFMTAQLHGGFVLTQTEAWRLEEEQEDDDDREDDLKDKRTRKKLTIKKKNGKFGYIV